jgi:hypothetical protein
MYTTADIIQQQEFEIAEPFTNQNPKIFKQQSLTPLPTSKSSALPLLKNF